MEEKRRGLKSQLDVLNNRSCIFVDKATGEIIRLVIPNLDPSSVDVWVFFGRMGSVKKEDPGKIS